jgi:ubiquinone/menaquinone biosynthesis C-methylase UbiE
MSSRWLEGRGARDFFRFLGELEQREKVLAELADDVEDGTRVLDIATGSGYLMRNLLGRKVSLTCMDIDPKALLSLRKEMSTREEEECSIDYICSDAACMPFKSSSFDVSVSWSALAHIEPWQEVVKEMFRVAGKAMTAEPKGEYVVRAFRDFRCKHRPPAPSEVAEEFKRYGEVRIEEDEFLVVIRGAKRIS